MGLNPMSLHQPQFHGSDPLNASAPTPSPTPGPNGFPAGYYGMNNNNMRSMGAPSNTNSNFYPNGAGAQGQSGSLGPMFGNNMQSMQSPMQGKSDSDLFFFIFLFPPPYGRLFFTPRLLFLHSSDSFATGLGIGLKSPPFDVALIAASPWEALRGPSDGTFEPDGIDARFIT